MKSSFLVRENSAGFITQTCMMLHSTMDLWSSSVRGNIHLLLFAGIGGPNRWAWYALAYLDFWPSKKKIPISCKPSPTSCNQSPLIDTTDHTRHQRPPAPRRTLRLGAGCLGDPARRRRPAGTLLGILAALVLQRNAPPRCRYVPPRVPLPTMPPRFILPNSSP